MNLATLRVEGNDDVLDAVVHRLDLEVDRWRKGEPKPRGGAYYSAGFDAIIADVETPAEMMDAIRKFMEGCKARDLSFSRGGISAEVAVGVTVGDSTQYMAFVDFTASDMTSMGSLGLNLSVAAYPTSDEANGAGDS